MENLYYNLSEQQFTRGRKALLWIFAGIFFLAGTGIIFMNIVFHDETFAIVLSSAPFGISFVVGIIAIIATFSRKDHFFKVDNNNIEFNYGFINPKKQLIIWNDIKEIQFPHKQKKVKVLMKNGSFCIVNLTWMEKKKSSHIRKHIFYGAKEKGIEIVKLQVI